MPGVKRWQPWNHVPSIWKGKGLILNGVLAAVHFVSGPSKKRGCGDRMTKRGVGLIRSLDRSRCYASLSQRTTVIKNTAENYSTVFSCTTCIADLLGLVQPTLGRKQLSRNRRFQSLVTDIDIAPFHPSAHQCFVGIPDDPIHPVMNLGVALGPGFVTPNRTVLL